MPTQPACLWVSGFCLAGQLVTGSQPASQPAGQPASQPASELASGLGCRAMDSFNPTPPWVGEGMDAAWAILEIWGFPLVVGAAVFLWAAPRVTKSANSMQAAGMHVCLALLQL